METKAVTFFGGVPTAPQVRRLMEKYKGVAPGDEIPVSEVAEIIGQEVRSNRFRTVTDAFRRELNRNNLVAVREREVFRILQNEERLRFGARGIGMGHRKMGRSVGVISSTPTENLSDELRSVAFHLNRTGQAIVASTREAIKEIAKVFGAPPKQLPRSKTG